MIPNTFNNLSKGGGLMEKYYLGLDISKGYADAVILDDNKQIVEPNFQLDDTFDGHCLLYQKLEAFFKSHPDSIVYSAVESTGGYENNWFTTLVSFQRTLNLKTARLNPVGVKNNSKAAMRRICTDKISAKNVAEYLIAHSENVSYEWDDSLSSLRKQWSFVKMLTKQRTQLYNQLESLLYSAHPEILTFCKDGMPQWVLKLLILYPTSKKLSKARKSSVAKIPYITNIRAEELISKAKKSVASLCDKIAENLVTATAQEIIHLNQTIDYQSKLIKEQCAIPEIDIIASFKGMGDFSAVGLMMEIQNITGFSSAKKLASYFGLHPIYKISGDGVGAFRMSKQGRKLPRQILFMVVLNAIQTNPLIREIYLDRTSKGMSKMAAIGLCMHKILRIIYGMLKHNKKFDPEIDRKNRELKVKIKRGFVQDKKRRYQAFDPMAPISRRQNIKRKETKRTEAVPKRNNNANCGIKTSALISN